jgi:Sec-independent protein translocase protein TatA
MRSYFSDARDRFAGARDRAGNAIGETASGVRDRVADAASRASETAASVGATVRTAKDSAVETASQWREAAGSAASMVRDTTSSAYEQAKSRVSDSRGALGGAASTLYGGVAQSAGRTAVGVKAFASGATTTSRDLLELCREQPLVMAGLGIALGAAVGAAFRSTQTEHQLMGEASDEIKERTRSFAQEQYEKSKSTAEVALDKVQHKIKESGPSLTDHPSLVPSDAEAGDREMQEPIRPERIGLRDEQS